MAAALPSLASDPNRFITRITVIASVQRVSRVSGVE
jgi:hypothetical protein